MARNEQMTDMVDNAATRSIFGPILEQIHDGDAFPQDVVMEDTVHATLSDKPTLQDVHNNQQPGIPSNDTLASQRTVDLTKKEASKDKEESGREHATPTPTIGSDTRFCTPTATVALRAQTPMSNSQPNVSHTPKSTSSRVNAASPPNVSNTPKSTSSRANATPPPKTPTKIDDDEPVFMGSRPTPPARSQSALSAKNGQATPSRSRTHSTMQEAQLQTLTKTPGKRPASVQIEPESSKKHKTPASNAAFNGSADVASTGERDADEVPNGFSNLASAGEINLDEATHGQDSDGGEEDNENAAVGDDKRPEEKSVPAHVFRELQVRANARIEKLRRQFRGASAMVQQLNEQIAELQEDVESKKHVINDRDDEIKALEAERDKLRDHNTMLNTRMAQFRMNEEDFMNAFKLNWETAAKRTVEAKNTKEMQKMKERIAREADRLQNKANKALEEARAIREQSKADIRKAKDDRDARVKALMPEHSRTVRKKDTDLEMKQAEIVKYERAFKIHEAQRVRLEQDKRDLERDLFNKKEAYRRDKISLEETRRELAETSGVLRRESRRIGIMDEEHAAEIQKYVTEIRVIRGALDEETQRAERAEHKIEELNRKLNRFEVAFARSEASNTARESYDTSPHGGEQPSSSPRSLLTVGRSAHDLPGEIVMQDDTIFDGLSTKVLGMQREFSDENAQKHSPVGDQHSQRVDSPKAD